MTQDEIQAERIGVRAERLGKLLQENVPNAILRNELIMLFAGARALHYKEDHKTAIEWLKEIVA
jgi:hypothetical protein